MLYIDGIIIILLYTDKFVKDLILNIDAFIDI